MNRLTKGLSRIGLIFIVLGIFGLAAIFYFWQKNNTLNSQAKVQGGSSFTTPTVVSEQNVLTGKPVLLIIPSLGLNLNIKDGVYDPKSAQWTLSNDSVHYALMTAQPNEQRGNTLIYGHYRPGVFSTLKSIRPGSEVIVKTDNNLEFKYKFTSSRVVDPSDISVFSYEGSPMLTLQTCTGTFMQNRQLFSFQFETVKKV